LIPIQPPDSGYSRGMVALLAFTAFVGISPVWHVLGIQQRHLLAATAASLLVLSYVHRRSLTAWALPVALILFGCALAAGVYWAEPKLTLYPLPLILSCLLLAQATPREVDRFVDVASYLMLALVLGGVIGLMLARSGVNPLLHFPNVDGRSNYFFYTTLTNAYWSGWIQAAGLYDEPGAFSFMICATAFMRHVTGRDYRLTWALLGLGLVTFSLAHLVFMAVLALSERISLRRIAFVALAVLLLIGAARATGMHITYRQYLFARVTLDVAQQRGFQGRITLGQNALDALQTVDRAVLLGVDSDCTVNYVACRQKWEYMGENPLGPMAHHGLLLAWPYYLFLALGLGFLVNGRRNLAFFALVLLFLQRPFVMAFGYSFLAVAPLWLQVRFLSRPGLTVGPNTGARSPDLVPVVDR
jgi:hypothetical protein